MGKTLTGLAAALALSATGLIAAPQNTGTSKVTITRAGVPAANVAVHVQPLNGASAVVGTTGAAGDLEFALSLVNKPTARFRVVVYDCENGQSSAVFVEAGADVPEKDDCRRTILAMVWMRAGSTVAVDLARGTVQTTGARSFLGTRNGQLAAGAGLAAIGAIALTAGGGGDSTTGQNNQTPAAFNRSGTYPVTIIVASDPGEHRGPVGMEATAVLAFAQNGATFTITPPSGSKIAPITGTVSGDQLIGEGRGTVAGRQNVLQRFVGTLPDSGPNQGLLSGTLTVGAGGELPGGLPIVYNISGRKQ